MCPVVLLILFWWLWRVAIYFIVQIGALLRMKEGSISNITMKAGINWGAWSP